MRATSLLIAAALALAAPSRSARAEDFWGEGVEVMTEDDLGDLRGGIAVAPGLEVNFGVEITTYVNGAPAVSTQLTWSDTGQFVEQTVGEIGQRIEDLSPEARAALGLEGLGDAEGILIADADGVTALVHNVTDGALQNIIVNTAAGRDLRQEVDVTLTLPGFAAVQESLLQERLGLRIQDDLRGIGFQ